ncbi:hypothetical protein C8R45DRAFT_1035204 [Mycena sanguinolenta]|nr:hypothetical protein C8R45DRAFT_1035204 [Mycena sanguinolenta]
MIFPQELIVEAIECLGNDSETLKTCSLVSWAWVSRCRSYLFETCVLTSENIVVFRDLLLSAECTFSSHIRRIKASRYSGRPDDQIFDDIAAAVRDLKDIRELHIEMKLARVHNDIYPLFCTGFMTAFPHVTRLDLGFTVEDHWRSWNFPTPLFEMISLFPALRELHLFEFWQHVLDAPDTRVPPPELHCLELRGSSMTPILNWLGTFNHLSKVDSLALWPVGPGNSSDVRAAMRKIGSTLCHLDIDLKNPEADHPSVFDLTLHPNLKTLIIRDEPYGPLEDFYTDCLLIIVKSLVAPTLEHLSMKLDVGFYEDFDWAALDEFLSESRFPNLRRVVINCSSHAKYCGNDDHSYVCCGVLAASGVFQTEW